MKARLLFPGSLYGKGLFQALLLPRLQKIRMFLSLSDDIFLLNFPLKAAQGALKRFAVLDDDNSQLYSPPNHLKENLKEISKEGSLLKRV